MAEIATLPNWKKGASAYERLSEHALEARAHPEKYSRFLVVREERGPNNQWQVFVHEYGEGETATQIGILEIAKVALLEKATK